ncbi:hypothetical protein EGK_11369, partial [Macaca mulatta]
VHELQKSRTALNKEEVGDLNSGPSTHFINSSHLLGIRGSAA